MTETQIRNLTNRELANQVLSAPRASAMELALANRLLDTTEDLEEAEKTPRCECS